MRETKLEQGDRLKTTLDGLLKTALPVKDPANAHGAIVDQMIRAFYQKGLAIMLPGESVRIRLDGNWISGVPHFHPFVIEYARRCGLNAGPKDYNGLRSALHSQCKGLSLTERNWLKVARRVLIGTGSWGPEHEEKFQSSKQ